MEGGDDFFKKRLEKDLAELKKMIDSHFGKFCKFFWGFQRTNPYV